MTYYSQKHGRRAVSWLHSRPFSLIGLPTWVGGSPPATSDSQGAQVANISAATMDLF